MVLNHPDSYYSGQTPLEQRVDELRQGLKDFPPANLAWRTGSEYTANPDASGVFGFRLWGSQVYLSWPDGIARQLDGISLGVATEALLLYYFNTADGTPLSGRWISFSELPDGRFYNQAYQGYSGNRLGQALKFDLERLNHACQAIGGERLGRGEAIPGDCAYSFWALPRVPLLASAWQGDEDFPASFQILFDASVSHYLPTDGCAILGSMLAGRIIKAATY